MSSEAAWPLNDVPALRLAYSSAALGAQLLASPCEVAVEWSSDGVTWTEAPDGRFLRIKRRTDGVDQAGVQRYELPGYSWMLRKLILFPGTAPLVDGKRAFLSATPGAILRTFVTEGQDRGALPLLTIDFDADVDSAGDAWEKILTIHYEPGLDLLTTLINLAEQGVCDFRMEGRTLRVFNADTELDRDLATGAAPIDLRYGRDIVEAPDTGTLEDAASAVLVVGEGGFRQSFVSSAGHGPWGRWEMYVGQGGVSDLGTATLLADAAIKHAAGERVQRIRSVALTEARWLPLRDYQPGDRVLAPGEGGALESLRVRQITLTRDQHGVVSGNLVLNDRLLERDLRLARRTAGIVGGSTASGGSGARPAPETPVPRTPAKPTGLIVNALPYIDSSGFPQGQITATWNPVTADASGVALTVGGYELFGRVNEVGAPWFLVALTQAGDVSATFSPLIVGEQYQFKVRATNLGQRGAFSDSVAVTIPDDPYAPPVPTAPQLATRLGVVHVTWDGLGVGAAVMPSDFARVRVWMQDPLAPGWAEIGSLYGAGALVVPGLPYGADREFRLTSVDQSGNESAASTSATIAATQLVNGDAATGSITTGALAANAVTAAKVAAGAIEASHLAANAVTADKLEAVLALVSRLVAGNPTGARVELNSSGVEAYNASSVQTVSVSAATGAVAIIGQLSTGTVGRRIVVNPAGSADPEIRWYPGSGTNYARIYADTDGAIVHVSGLSPDTTRRSQVIQRGDEWRAQIYDPATGLAGGGYMFAKPDELEVGYNDASANLHRFRFTSAAAEFKGKWTFTGSEAGLIMRTVSLSGGSAYNVLWTFTMLTVPRVVFTADNPIPDRLAFHMRTPTTTQFTLRSSESSLGTPTAFTVQLNLWAWRM
ncbi:fibronectin type III domain-containing protein [Streptosporangium sp. NPDC020072]|uniref:fibronectin type III domain-containing protein n=1 Tax=Streptosporangium sp. NPDC020072 TaxID=3154788 RepID=UPI0034239379